MKEDIEADIYILEVWLQQIKSNKQDIEDYRLIEYIEQQIVILKKRLKNY